MYRGGIHVERVRGGSYSVTAEGAAPRVRALNLERESCEHLRWIHLKQVQHCTDLPRQVTFPAHTEQGKIMGPGLGLTLPLIKRRRRMRKRRRTRKGQEKRKRENKQLILKKLCAALLRSFRGQHSEKMKGSARGNWNRREGQQSFRPNPNGVGDRTTTLRRLLIGAMLFYSPEIFDIRLRLGVSKADVTAYIEAISGFGFMDARSENPISQKLVVAN